MSFDVDDDTFSDLAEEERRRDERKGTSGPLVRLLLILLVFVVAVVGIGLIVRSVLHSREVSSYENYLTSITSIVKDSDATGRQLSQRLTKPGDTTRKDLQALLDKDIQSAKGLQAKATALEVPEDLRAGHQWFLAVMELRSQGFQDLRPSLLNALEVRDLALATEQITSAMQLLLLSDVAYNRLFMRTTTEVLKTKDIPGLVVPATSFMDNDTLATKAKVKEILASLKSSESIQSVHGVALLKVTAMPAEKQLESGSTYNLQSSEKLSFDVTVENQGNMVERNVPVTVRLSSQSSAQPQIVTLKVDELKPKQTKTVTLKNVNPAPYGEDSLIRVEVGPVPGEKNKGNNVVEAHLVFTL